MKTMKRMLCGVLLLGIFCVVAGFMYFAAGGILSGTRWEISSHGTIYDAMSLVGVIGMILAAIGGFPLAVIELVKR